VNLHRTAVASALLALTAATLLSVRTAHSAASSASSITDKSRLLVSGTGAQEIWSSGWLSLSPNSVLTLTHGLGQNPEALAVDLWMRDLGSAGLGIHQRGLAGLGAGANLTGAFWQQLTATTVQVGRLRDDTKAE
jgi:hypothetical protein